MKLSLPRGARSGLALAVAATALAQPMTAAAAPVPPTQLVADWSAGQLNEGLAVGQFGADPGLSIDAGLAFDAIGRVADANRVADAVADQLVTSDDVPYGYVSSDEYDFSAPYDFVGVGHYANATAKAAAFAERVGRDARTAYPSVDLIAQLETLTDNTTGVIADDSSFGNYANTIGQAFAAEALTVADSAEAQAATAALLDQQCPAGYFRFGLGAAACAADAAGVAPDTTGLAVISLLESGNTSPEVRSAIAAAAAWLESIQRPDGSLTGDASAPGANSNSTGLAAWALGRAGRATSAEKAAAWVRSMQVADAGACASQAPTGAIAYNAEDLAAGRTGGISATRDKWRRASFQAAPALQWAPAATSPLSVSTAATAVEKSSVTVTVRGVAAGEQACVSFSSDARRVIGTGSDLSVSFTLPAGAATHTFTAATLGAAATGTTIATAIPVPPAPTTAGAPVVGRLVVSKVEEVRKKSFRVEVACNSAQECAGRLRVRTATKVRLDGMKKRKFVSVSERRYRVAPGDEKRLVLRLTRTARTLVADGRVKVKAIQTAPGAERSVTKFWLRARG